MTATPTLLPIGHSHVECFRNAVAKRAHGDVGQVNLQTLLAGRKMSDRELVAKVVEQAPIKEPDTICLCIGGNRHNILGLIENPDPFSIGDATKGVVPPEIQGRHAIPTAVIKDCFIETMPLSLIPALYQAFPKARRLYLNAPPPMGDWAHIAENPGPFKDMLDLGPAPDALRLRLYDIQTEVFKDVAAATCAEFVEPDAALKDDKGFLAAAYCRSDPTHANNLYGNIMLEKILEIARGKK